VAINDYQTESPYSSICLSRKYCHQMAELYIVATMTTKIFVCFFKKGVVSSDKLLPSYEFGN
jgi:hypothetical protein